MSNHQLFWTTIDQFVQGQGCLKGALYLGKFRGAETPMLHSILLTLVSRKANNLVDIHFSTLSKVTY